MVTRKKKEGSKSKRPPKSRGGTGGGHKGEGTKINRKRGGTHLSDAPSTRELKEGIGPEIKKEEGSQRKTRGESVDSRRFSDLHGVGESNCGLVGKREGAIRGALISSPAGGLK